MTTFIDLEKTEIIKVGDLLVSKEGLTRAPFNRSTGHVWLSVQGPEKSADYDDLRIRNLGHGRLGGIELVKTTEDLWDRTATLRVAQALMVHR